MRSTITVRVPKDEPEILSPSFSKLASTSENPIFRYVGSERKSMDSKVLKYGIASGVVLVGSIGAVLAMTGVFGRDSAKGRHKGSVTEPVASAATAGAANGAALPFNPDREVRFGIAAPFSGPSKELGREMALGLQAAFAGANEGGGVAGRKVTLVTADDGYEPARTPSAMAKLHDVDSVMGYVGNVGTPTATVALPYALKNHMLFFGAFTGAESLRSTPPDRYVFNYRPSYAEETEAAVNYLVRVRGIAPQEIAVFAQQDGYGDSGFNGVAKSMRALKSAGTGPILRMGYVRNNLDLTAALAALGAHKGKISAIVMIASYRPAAKFIEAVRPKMPNVLFTNVSFVGSSALAEELKLLGPKYMKEVMVTQTVPSITGSSTIALEYKSALERYFPGEAPDYVSFEGFIDGKLLLEGLRRSGKNLSTEQLVSTLENLRGFDLGLGSPISLSTDEHQASHRIWGTELTPEGTYRAVDLK